MKDYLEYKGYKGTVEYSKEDDCLCGKVIGMSKDLIMYEGSTLEELRSDFNKAVDDYIAGCIADGIEPRKPFSGKMILRIPSGLHERIAISASSSGKSINDYLVFTLDKNVPQYGTDGR
ncbi:MAG: type II toxin-antitoxin system HicB family antitoxin [Bacteroidales bacterium]|nr:type II toxin-antitoxin system HicB family antitoxin [Bacteroidales bacterium]